MLSNEIKYSKFAKQSICENFEVLINNFYYRETNYNINTLLNFLCVMLCIIHTKIIMLTLTDN